MSLYRRAGGGAVVLAITLFSVAASVIATWVFVTPLLTPQDRANGMLFVSMAIAVAVPGLVAPLASLALVSLIVRLEAAYQKVLALSTTDPLTDVTNRRGLFAQAEARLATARTGDQTLVGIIDLDHFKIINDSHGHYVGDLVLVDVVRCLQQAVGPGGIVGRIGGDEFAFVVLGTRAEVDQQARTIRERCRTITLHYDRLSVPVTVAVSIGMVLLEPGESFDQGLARADDALYAVKESARTSTRARVRVTRTHERGN